jgi:hypothetical protein
MGREGTIWVTGPFFATRLPEQRTGPYGELLVRKGSGSEHRQRIRQVSGCSLR